MQIELPNEVIDVLRDALSPVLERLIDEKVEQRRPLLLSVNQVAEELSCSRSSVYGLIRGGYLEAISVGRSYRVATATLHAYVEELTKPRYEREIVTARSGRTRAATSVARSSAGRSRRTPAASVVTATKPPRSPRPKQRKISKEEAANKRWTIEEFADRWYGLASATALMERSGVVLTKDADGRRTFRYGDLVEWMERNDARFTQWLEEFDPVLKQGNDRVEEGARSSQPDASGEPTG